MVELPARQVDGHESDPASGADRSKSATARTRLERLPAQEDGKAGVLRYREQVVEILNRSIGAAQAKQRFESFQLAVREPVDGLILESELPLVEGRPQLALPLLLAA